MTDTDSPVDPDATVDAIVCAIPEIVEHLVDPVTDHDRQRVSVQVSDNTIGVRIRLPRACERVGIEGAADAVRAALARSWPGAAIDVSFESAAALPNRPRPAEVTIAGDAVLTGSDPTSDDH